MKRNKPYLGCLRRGNAEEIAHSDKLRQGFRAHFPHGIGPMDLDGNLAHPQPGSNLLVQGSGCHPRKHVLLPSAEGIKPLP